MTVTITTEDEGLTLVLARTIAAPRESVWRCWSEPALLSQWFCPAPWRVEAVDMALTPGGRWDLVMAGPEGERMESRGCILLAEPPRRLVFTDHFTEGFRPAPEPFMTGFVELEAAEGAATRLRWGARHRREEDVARHREMGFEPGWTAASAQLDALARSLA